MSTRYRLENVYVLNGTTAESCDIDDENPILDLAVVNQADDDVSIRLGNGNGNFTSTAPDVPVGNFPVSIAVGLFNADSIWIWL